MPTADLRALAGKLGLLKPCEVCLERGWMARWHDGLDKFDSCTCPACVAGHRLPSEAEVRAAIFEAGFGLTIYAGQSHVTVEARTARLLKSLTTSAHAGEADPNDLVLLALLRALEAARG